MSDAAGLLELLPFTFSGAPAIMVLALLLMHVVAAVVVTGVLTALSTRDD
jgi:hypothetical protein